MVLRGTLCWWRRLRTLASLRRGRGSMVDVDVALGERWVL